MDGALISAAKLNAATTGYTNACPHRAALTQAVLDRMTVGLIGLDADLHVVLCNHSAAEMLGLTAPKLWHAVPFDHLLGKSAKLDGVGQLALAAALCPAGTLSGGDACHPGDRLAKVSLADGRVLHIVVSQAADRHRLVTLTIELAGVPAERTDGLTGLSDRRWFHERVATMLAAPDQADQVAVLMIDLDRFKAVNDSHGHPVGDALLQTVARRLCSAVRDGDVVSRLGG